MLKLNSQINNTHYKEKSIKKQPDCNSSWAICVDSNYKKENSYENLYGFDIIKNEGCCIYINKETCDILGYESNNGIIIMNDNTEEIKFRIPYDQYLYDFGLN